MRIINRIKSYYSKKSRLAVVLDILFYLFILLMLIPPTRKKISSMILRVTLHQPVLTRSSDGSGNVYEEITDWELVSFNGERIRFSELQDSVIFLNFWATWCPPCIAEMPSIQDLYSEFGDRVSFLLVSREDRHTVDAFLEKHGYTLPTHSPLSQIPIVFDHRSIPTTFIISRSGEVVMKHKGATKWDGEKIKRMIEELLEE